MIAYHFLKDDMTAGAGNEPAWKVGEEREHKGKLKLCDSGYHSCETWYDALLYAPGSMACIVEVSGKILKGIDKQVSSKRRLIKSANAKKVLRAWACDCAERALKKAKVGELTAARDARGAAWDALWAAGDVWAEIKWQKCHLNKLMKELFE